MNEDPMKQLPGMQVEVWGNTIYAYLLTITTFLGLCIGFYLFRLFLMRQLKSVSSSKFRPLAEFLEARVCDIRPWLVVSIFFAISLQRLELSDLTARVMKFAAMTLVTFLVTRALTQTLSYFVTRAKVFRQSTADASARNSVENLAAIGRVLIWLAALLFLLDNFGVNISTFVAGLGIGGIAIALAAQAILGDAFSSFSIALDKPFEVGDYIIIDNLQGTVEAIGLKTTRIRSLGGELLVFGNSDLTKSRISNYKKMNRRRINFQVGVAHETSDQALEDLALKIGEAVKDLANATFDRAHFFKFEQQALVYDIVYYVESSDYNVYMDIQQKINLRIRAICRDLGIKLASYETHRLVIANYEIFGAAELSEKRSTHGGDEFRH